LGKAVGVPWSVTLQGEYKLKEGRKKRKENQGNWIRKNTPWQSGVVSHKKKLKVGRWG